MAQYFEDFENFTLDTYPTGWTEQYFNQSPRVVSDAMASNGKALSIPGTDSGRYAITWDEIDSDVARADVEILMRTRRLTNSTNTSQQGGAGRVSGAVSSETLISGMFSDLEKLRGSEYNNGSFTALTASGDVVPSTTDYRMLRVRINGSTIQYKGWVGGINDEPVDYQVTDNIPNVSGAGSVGIFRFFSTSVMVDWIGVGTGGAAAPHEPISEADVDNLNIGTSIDEVEAEEEGADIDNMTIDLSVDRAESVVSTDDVDIGTSIDEVDISIAVSVSVSDKAITATYNIGATINQLIAAIEADIDASALISIALKSGETGDGLIQPLASTNLSGGNQYTASRYPVNPFDSVISGKVTEDGQGINAVEGARIIAERGGVLAGSDITNQDGDYSLTGLNDELFYVVVMYHDIKASIEVNPTGDNNDHIITSKLPGDFGDEISIQYQEAT